MKAGADGRAHRAIHIVVREFARGGLQEADEHDVGADGHEGDVEVRRIHVLPRRLVPVAPTDLQTGGPQPPSIAALGKVKKSTSWL